MSSHEPGLGSPVTPWPVDRLRLDPDNPRLAETLPNATQTELLLEFYRSYDLHPLMLSMSQHGYFSEEPLIGLERTCSKTQDKIVVVVEGNRRLASLLLLLDDKARKAVGADKHNLPEITNEDVLRRLNPVPVKLYPKRADIVPYLGVRHIRGVKDWDPLAKARYVRWLIDQEQDIAEIARSIGVQRGTVRRWLLTLHVMEQANEESDTPWDESPGGFKFSWLYTSLGYARVRDHLQLEDPKREAPQPHPVKQEQVPLLLDHMRDLYGPPPGDSQRAQVKDSRELRKLAAVYDSPEAFDVFRGGATLEEAYARSAGEAEELLDYLRQANLNLERALGIAYRHRDQAELLRLATRAAEAGLELKKVLGG